MSVARTPTPSPCAGPVGYERSAAGEGRWQPPSVEHLAQLLPQYAIERLLGHGGMGAVYQGRQRSLDRAVAIKILPPGVDAVDASYIERFKNEARIMAKLDHPAIVPVYDFGGTVEGQLYIVMAFVDGTDVARMIHSQGRLPPEHALAIAAHVCDALGYAHSHGIVHRDIKPANILINRDGAVKVADFGLAKADEPGSSGLTKTGMAMGTPDYVAPEALITGMQVDGRADLYAIGVMLYHMLTGEVPRGAFDLPSRRIGTDPRFDAIILKAMKMDREERYQTSGEIRRDLDVILTLPLVQAGGESSAAIPQEGSAGTPARNSNQGGSAAKKREAEKSLRAPFSRQSSPNPKSKTTMLALTTAAAAIVIAGAFVALKPGTQGTTQRADESGVPAAALQDTAAKSGPLSPLSGQANPPQTTAPGTVRTTISETPARPVLIAQGSTTPKFTVADTRGNAFIGEWIEEQDPKGPRVIIIADGRVQLWRNGSQDQRPNGTFWWTGWSWRLNGADLEVLTEKKTIYQTWSLTGSDTATSTGEKVIQKRRAKDLWSNSTTGSTASSPTIASDPPADAVRFGSSSYKLIQEVLSFDDAQNRCVSMGGHLATITSVEEQKFIESIANKTNPVSRLILGGYYDGAQWRWITGEPWGFEYWDKSNDTSKLKANDVLCMPLGGHWKHFLNRSKSDASFTAFVCEWDGSPAAVAQVPAAASTVPATVAMPASPPLVGPPATLPPELTTLQQQYDKLLVERVTGIYEADVAKLNAGYLAGLDRAAATAQSGGELDTVLAITAEKKLLAAKQPVPATDDATTPDALKNLRTIYRTSLTKLDEQRTTNHTALLTPYTTRLKQIEADLTKAGRIPDAVAVKSYREGLGTNPVPTTPEVAATPAATTTPMKEAPAPSVKLPKGDPRAAAEWVLSMGGKVMLFAGGNKRTISKLEDLPPGKLGAYGVALDGKDVDVNKVTDADMNRFAGQEELQEVILVRLSLTEAGMRFLETCPNVTDISFDELRTSEAWITHLKRLKKLTGLSIHGKVGYRGLGLEQLAGLPIKNLRLFRSNLNDQGLAAIKDFKEVYALSLEETEVTDAGLANLTGFKKMKVLNVGSTKEPITAQGLERLKGVKIVELGFGSTVEGFTADLPKVSKLFPDVTVFTLPRILSYTSKEIALLGHSFPKLDNILTYSTGFGDDACAGLVEVPGLKMLSIINAKKITDVGLAPIAQLKSLHSLTVHGCQMTDRGLELFLGNKSVKNLFIHSVPVTDVAVAAFKKARPDVMVER